MFSPLASLRNRETYYVFMSQTRSALSLVTSPSVDVFLPARLYPPKWTVPLSSVGTTSTISPSTVRSNSCFYCWVAYSLRNSLITDRYEKRHKNLAAHLSPAFRVEIGDQVTVGTLNFILINHSFYFEILKYNGIGQCRPLSKTVRFNVLRVAKNKAAAKAFGKF